jgi:hypothetical protein
MISLRCLNALGSSSMMVFCTGVEGLGRSVLCCKQQQQQQQQQQQ